MKYASPSTRARIVCKLICLPLIMAGSAQAALTFYVNNVAGFNSANTGTTLTGTEDWENNNLAPAAISSAFNDSLQPGVANGPFPSGSSAALNMTVQSNTGGASSASLAPFGFGALVAASDGAAGFSGNFAPTSQLSVNLQSVSLDLIFGTPYDAVSLIPLYFSDTGQPTSGTITVKVYSQANALLGTTTVSGVADTSEANFVGIVVTGGDKIGRINLWDGSATNNYAGADLIRGYAVPEPSGTGILAGLILLLAAKRDRSRR